MDTHRNMYIKSLHVHTNFLCKGLLFTTHFPMKVNIKIIYNGLTVGVFNIGTSDDYHSIPFLRRVSERLPHNTLMTYQTYTTS